MEPSLPTEGWESQPLSARSEEEPTVSLSHRNNGGEEYGILEDVITVPLVQTFSSLFTFISDPSSTDIDSDLPFPYEHIKFYTYTEF